MKTLITLVASVTLISIVQASQTCLYCKRQDLSAGFLYSFSYCGDYEEKEKCISDSWNYFAQWKICQGDMVQGF